MAEAEQVTGESRGSVRLVEDGLGHTALRHAGQRNHGDVRLECREGRDTRRVELQDDDPCR